MSGRAWWESSCSSCPVTVSAGLLLVSKAIGALFIPNTPDARPTFAGTRVCRRLTFTRTLAHILARVRTHPHAPPHLHSCAHTHPHAHTLSPTHTNAGAHLCNRTHRPSCALAQAYSHTCIYTHPPVPTHPSSHTHTLTHTRIPTHTHTHTQLHVPSVHKYLSIWIIFLLV